jgi:hypothetical protein
MRPDVSTKDATVVAGAVQTAYLGVFPDGDGTFVPRIFSWAVECFTGRLEDYLPIDAGYHDFEHTLQGTLCLAGLLRGRHLAGAEPVLSRRQFGLALLAMLLHDTGYLKKKDDQAGTGAKYTATHVRRGADFAAEFLTKQRFDPVEIRAVQHMILCTGFNDPLTQIPFRDEAERIAGLALGTADLLGQMAAADYVDKLPALYAEFAEAARYSPGAKHSADAFASVEELRRKTPDFWEHYVRPKLDRDFAGLHRFLNDPYPAGPNGYLDAIEANIARLRRELATSGLSVSATRG